MSKSARYLLITATWMKMATRDRHHFIKIIGLAQCGHIHISDPDPLNLGQIILGVV